MPGPAIAAKIYFFSPPPNHPYKSARSGPPRGAYRDRHGRGSECGGRGSARCAERIAGRALACERSAARQTNGAEAYGKSVWFWRPWLASSRRRFAKPDRAMQTVNSPAMEARRIRLQGERAISRQTIAQGKPDALRRTCMLVCAFLSAYCTRTAGAARTRSSLRPLHEGGKRAGTTRARRAARMHWHIGLSRPDTISADNHPELSPVATCLALRNISALAKAALTGQKKTWKKKRQRRTI